MLTKRNPLDPHTKLAGELLKELDRLVATGAITSESDLVLSLYEKLLEFYTSLGVPTISAKAVQRGELPIRDRFNNFFSLSKSDSTRAIRLLTELRKLVLAGFNAASAEREGLLASIKSAVAAVDKFRLWSADTKGDFIWFSDVLSSTNNLDVEASTVNVADGVATLGVSSVDTVSPASMSLLVNPNGSVGFAGNALEVRNPGWNLSTTGKKEPNPELYGGVDNAGLVMLSDVTKAFDGDPSSWFEWEAYYARMKQKVESVGTAWVSTPNGVEQNIYDITKGYGWNTFKLYPGGELDTGPNGQGFPIVADIKSKQTISVVIEVDFSTPQHISNISVLPYLRGSTLPTISSVEVWRSGEAKPFVLEAMRRSTLTSELKATLGNADVFIWSFPIITATKIRINLMQSYSYPVKIAHKYKVNFIETETTRKYVWGLMKNSKTKNTVERVPTDQYISGNYSVKPMWTENILAAGLVGFLIHPFSLAWTLASLTGFASKEVQTTIKATEEHYDIFDAERMMIGLRDVGFMRVLYNAESILISKTYVVPKPISSVALQVEDEVPSSFGAGDWIVYEIAFDSDDTWYPVVPMGRAGESAIFPPSGTANSVRMRARIRRPSGNNSETPIVYWYALKCMPAPEVLSA